MRTCKYNVYTIGEQYAPQQSTVMQHAPDTQAIVPVGQLTSCISRFLQDPLVVIIAAVSAFSNADYYATPIMANTKSCTIIETPHT